MAVAKRGKPQTGPNEGSCGARKKRGGWCSFRAGYRTPHVGQGKCYLHGGLTPIKHGRYSAIKRESIRQLIEQHEADPDPLNILPELAASRALFQDFIERYDANSEALRTWHESYRDSGPPMSQEALEALRATVDEFDVVLQEQEEEATEERSKQLALARQAIERLGRPVPGKPVQLLDISDAYRIVSDITKIVERIERIRAANAISRPDLVRVMMEMARVVETYVADSEVLQRIKTAWLSVKVA